MMLTAYRCLYSLLLLLLSPFFLYGLYKPKANKPAFGLRWKEHFGLTPTLGKLDLPVIWVHAVSVGEVIASANLITALYHDYPEHRILVTTTTSTGAERVTEIQQKLADSTRLLHRYMPLDLSFCIKSFLKTVQPKLMLIIETELWPNTIFQVSKNNIPIVLVNARLSVKSASGYHRLRFFSKHLFSRLDKVLSIHPDDALRFKGLGVSAQKSLVTGSLKYDVQLDPKQVAKGVKLRQLIGLNRPVWIAASTHAGEDEKILVAHRKAKQALPDLLLILVPRHPERFDSVYALIKNEGFTCSRRTKGFKEGREYNDDVYLGDTMGEMITLMNASDVVFIGGSLLGNQVGGHNFIEPALLAKPIFSGPSYYNFKDLAEQLIAVNALKIIDQQDIADFLINEIFTLPMTLNGSNGLEVIKENNGSLSKVLAYIKSTYIKELH